MPSASTKTSLDDGSTLTQTFTNGVLVSAVISYPADAADISDTKLYTAVSGSPVLTSDTVVHADKSKDIYYYSITGKTYVAEHDVYNPAGTLTAATRTHADSTVDYTYVLGADGTKTTVQYDATGSLLKSQLIVYPDGSTDTSTYANGVLTNETVVHADKSKDIYLFNISGKTYVAEHDVYNAAGVLTAATRTHSDGSVDYTYLVGADGTKTTVQYSATGSLLKSCSIVCPDGSTDTSTYTNGVLTNQTVVHADKSKDIYLSNVTGKTYVAEHDVYNAAGVLAAATRTHADGTVDYTYVLGADGTKTTIQYDATGSLLKSQLIVYPDGSTDTSTYTNGFLTNETVVHADKSKDVYYSCITGRTYVTEHNAYNAAGVLTAATRTHADGTVDYTYVLGADGTKTTVQYDATGSLLKSRLVIIPDGSSDAFTYTNGVLTNETVVHADKSKDVYLSNITGKAYVAEHDVYNVAGVLTAVTRTRLDGTQTTVQYDATGSVVTSSSIVNPDGSSDTFTYTNGVLTSETVVHADKSADVYLSNVTGKTYVAEHDVYNPAGVLTAATRTHADGTVDYTYVLGADGTTTIIQYDATGSVVTSRSILNPDGSSDTRTYVGGVLTSEIVVHADKSADVYLSNVTGTTYVAEHDVYNTAGVLTAATRTHADGTIDYTYVLGADGTAMIIQYDATGSGVTSRAIVNPDGSSDTRTYVSGVLTSETVVHADKSADVYFSNITGQTYIAEHDVYNTAGALTLTMRTSADGSTDTFTYTNGVLTNETVVHADNSKDVYLSNITGTTYVAEHDVYNSAGVLTAATRTHTDGTVDYTYALGTDGIKTTIQYDATGSGVTSRSIVNPDGSSDSVTYTNGILTSETVVHADKSKDVYLSNVAGKTYVAEHDVYNTAGVLTAVTRTHANGSIDYTYMLAADGTKTTLQYDATGGVLKTSLVINPDGSSDSRTYVGGVLVNETVVHADRSEDVYLSNITGKTYVAEHDVYNTAGVLTAATRTHADGTLDYIYTLGADGTKTALQYDVTGSLLRSRLLISPDGSTDTFAYANGVLNNETVVHADMSKDVYLFNITGKAYVAEHDVYNVAGVLTAATRTHADGTVDYTYVLGADGTKTTLQYDSTGSLLKTRSVISPDGSSDTFTYTNGVLTNETVVHADKSSDIYFSNIAGQTYVAEHDVYNGVGVLTAATRTHADGTVDYTYVLGADGTTTIIQYDATGSVVTSRSILYSDGSSDTRTYVGGVLTSETVVHADKSADVYLFNVTGKTYVAEHDVYNSAGVLTAATRTHADGTIDYTYAIGSDGTKTIVQYNATGSGVTSSSIVNPDGSSDTRTYVSGVLTSETVVHADKSADVYLSNITGKTYVAEHDVYNTAGVLTAVTRTNADGSTSDASPAPTVVQIKSTYDAAGVLVVLTTIMADGTTDTKNYANVSGQSVLTSEVAKYPAGSLNTSDTKAFVITNGQSVLAQEIVLHADKSKDIYLSNITGKTYVAEHDVYNAAGVLTAATRTHADATVDYTYVLDADGTKTTIQYDSTGTILKSRSITSPAGSTDAFVYSNGILVSETVTHSDKSKDIYYSNITGRTYAAEHDVYNASGVLTATLRTHADGSVDYTYTLGADSTKTTFQYDSTGALLQSRLIISPDGSTDTFAYKNGILASETVVHTDKSKDVYLSNIAAKAYTAEHDVYNAAGVLVGITRTHDDGTLSYTYDLNTSTSTQTASYYDASGVLGAITITTSDKTMETKLYSYVSGQSLLVNDATIYGAGLPDISDTKIYSVVDGKSVLVTDTVIHSDSSKDVYLSNITNENYVAEHDVYNADGYFVFRDQTNLDGSHETTTFSVPQNETFSGASSDQFVFKANFGHDTITSFDASRNTIDFSAGAFTSVSDMLLNHTTDTPLGAVIDFGQGNTLTLTGETKQDLLAYQSAFHIATQYFSDDSLWNTPIDLTKITYSDPNSIQNVQFRDPTLGNAWIQSESLFFTTPDDAPMATWYFNTLNTVPIGNDVDNGFTINGSVQIATPINLLPTHASDGWVVFTIPNTDYYWESWGTTYDTTTQTWHSRYLVEGNFDGTGWGTALGVGAGIRAAGASLMGGLVTSSELDDLSINHALAIELSPHQLKAGTSQLDQFVFPAVSADSNSLAYYDGTIPMGAHFVLPTSVDIYHAGLTPEGLALAEAYQKYGGYVVDQAAGTTSIAMVDDATPAQLADLRHDAMWIRDHLVMV